MRPRENYTIKNSFLQHLQSLSVGSCLMHEWMETPDGVTESLFTLSGMATFQRARWWGLIHIAISVYIISWMQSYRDLYDWGKGNHINLNDYLQFCYISVWTIP